jgi:hypothetical protein
MSVRNPRQGMGENHVRPTTPTPAAATQPAEDVSRLGEALRASTEDVLDRTRARTKASGQALDDPVRESFEQICETSTVAVAEWMTGGNPEVARKAGREVWHIFGQLAARRRETGRRCARHRCARAPRR